MGAALLVMDVQTGIVDRYAAGTWLLDRLNSAIDAARTASMAVIFVRIAFRPGYPRRTPLIAASEQSLRNAERPLPTRVPLPSCIRS